MTIWNNASTVMYNGAVVDSVMYNGNVIWPTAEPVVYDTAEIAIRSFVTNPTATKLAYTVTDSLGRVVGSSDYTTSTSNITAEGVGPFSIQMSGSSAPYNIYTLPHSARVTGLGIASAGYTQNTYSADGTKWTAKAVFSDQGTGGVVYSGSISAKESAKEAYVKASASAISTVNIYGIIYPEVVSARYNYVNFDPVGYLAQQRSSYRGRGYPTSTSDQIIEPSAFVVNGDYAQSMRLTSYLYVRGPLAGTNFDRDFNLESGDVAWDTAYNVFDWNMLSAKRLTGSRLKTSTPIAVLSGKFSIDNANNFALNLLTTGGLNQYSAYDKYFVAYVVIR